MNDAPHLVNVINVANGFFLLDLLYRLLVATDQLSLTSVGSLCRAAAAYLAAGDGFWLDLAAAAPVGWAARGGDAPAEGCGVGSLLRVVAQVAVAARVLKAARAVGRLRGGRRRA
jgi:hypothetical protein